MLEKSISTFVDELSSKSPIPGGGGASAYVGALGIALGSMVGNLTIGKKKYKHFEEDILELIGKSEIIIEHFKQLVKKDAEAFYPLSKAYGLPQNSDEEKHKKEAALQEALVEAAMVPLEIAETCLQAINILEEYAQKGTRIAISDVGVGVAFCKAALQSSKFNVMINTKMMNDKKLKNSIENKLREIEIIGMKKSDELLKYVENQLIK
ncbi:cyclodeaminase/cyclohydrolase family protein [Sporosalibacterium faouarense]|uniref:cyclodeaminase/cyclohydrolase family protein n=1 Tax=Sporosalibacterium faouarense TaxID=516123 RepID=UPI00141C29E8|nr:cyclodeaminase/cyclohydrolase family protein [Sporosalibacterium faouarense]MTI48449.1 cyclodeaminase/cyclohydrolase family protein [Bacillota bacterium]